MNQDAVEHQLHLLTNALVQELVRLTPESMSEIQFEIMGTDDGGANLGLLENHPDVLNVALSEQVFTIASQYLPLVKVYVEGWTRTFIVLRKADEGWSVSVDYEQS